MRIAEIHVYQMDLPLSGKGYRMSEGSYTALDSTVVEIVSDAGISGWGETCPVGPTYSAAHALGARAALDQMAQSLIGTPVTGPLTMRRWLGRYKGQTVASRGSNAADLVRQIARIHKVRTSGKRGVGMDIQDLALVLRRAHLLRTPVNRPETRLKPLDASRALSPTQGRSLLPPPIRPGPLCSARVRGTPCIQ